MVFMKKTKNENDNNIGRRCYEAALHIIHTPAFSKKLEEIINEKKVQPTPEDTKSTAEE